MQTNRSLNSTHGLACIINPEHVEPQYPDHLNESLNDISPRAKGADQNTIEIFIDQETPVHVSGHFAQPTLTDKSADKNPRDFLKKSNTKKV